MAESLIEFRQRWSGCTRCSAGQLREQRSVYRDGVQTIPQPIFGRGKAGGLFLVGDPVDQTEEKSGLFTSDRHQLILQLLAKLLPDRDVPVYVTQATMCRPCVPRIGMDGKPMVRQGGLPIYQDAEPAKDVLDACRERLLEEIYAIDPELIVALGPLAMRTLTNKYWSETARGTTYVLEVPGKWVVPRVGSKNTWGRKQHGKVVYPLDTHMVRYTVLMTGSPKQAVTYSASKDPHRELPMLAKDLTKAITAWRYVQRTRKEEHGT